MPRRRAVVVGFSYYGHALARLMNAHATSWSMRYFDGSRIGTLASIAAARDADAIVSFGGPGPNAALAAAARRRGIPVVVIWAGSDVQRAAREPQMLELIKCLSYTHLADGPWLVDELRALGLEARYVPVTAVEPCTLAPLPDEFSVFTYLPEPRRAFYGERTVYAIARGLPNVRFDVIGRGAPNPGAPSNVRFLGYVKEMGACIDAHTALLRMPEHDGKSMLVLETLARARHVLWSYPFTAATRVRTATEAIATLADLRDLHARGDLELNRAGTVVAAAFEPARLALRFARELDTAVERRETRAERGATVAISGLNLFSAQVMRLARERSDRWDVVPMRTSARLEVLASMLELRRADVWYSIGAPIGSRWLYRFARLLRKPHVMHWVGSDLERLCGDRALQRYCRGRGIVNLAEVDWTARRLHALGIDAQIAPLPVAHVPTELPSMPSEFTVLFYVPTARGAFYGRAEYERLIRAFAHRAVRFLVVGGGELYVPPGARVERLGWCDDLDPVYARTSVLVRLTRGDGLSIMVLEALMRGRYVLWTQSFPFAQQTRSYREAAEDLERLLELHERGALALRTDAARATAAAFEPTRALERIVDAWERAR